MRKYYWWGLAGMLAVYTIYFLLAREPFVRYYLPVTRRWLHLIQLAGIVLVYTIGIWALQSGKKTNAWQLSFWHIAHFILIPLLAALGIADWWMGGLPQGWRMLAQSLGEALISPVLFVGLWLLESLPGIGTRQ